MNDLDSKTIFYASSMLLFSTMNRVLDLGAEIVDAKNLGTPSTYRDIFWLLLKAKVIGKDFYEEFTILVKYRNILSHEYSEITEKDVFDGIKRLEYAKKFVGQMKNLINKELA